MKALLTILLALLGLTLAARQPVLPITSYDYALPENNVSPICIGMGGLNVTNTNDFFASYTNPALIGSNDKSALLTSFRLADNDKLTFAQAASLSSALNSKQFKYFTLLTKQSAWTYQPMARVHISEMQQGKVLYYDYQLDKVQATLAASDKSWQPIGFGMNLKYLAGRLVYLHGADFIDDKVRGFSSDIGLTLQTGSMTYGVAAYDLISRMWWENYDAVSLQRRIALGAQYQSDNLTLNGGLQGKLSRSTDTTFHLGMQYGWDMGVRRSGGSKTAQGLAVRLGMYSHDFSSTSAINYTFGSGYNYNILRFDFSLNNSGLKIKDSEYLFSLGVGLP